MSGQTDDTTGTSAGPESIRRAPARRILAGFILASVAVHAGVIVLAPGLASRSGPPPVVLEVVLQKAVPLPLTEHAPPPKPRRAEPEPRKRAATAPQPPAEQPPILAMPAESAPTGSTFSAPAPNPAAPVAPVPQAAPAPPVKVAVAPPTFNAAYLRNPAPRYPLAARRAGEQGTATLRVLVQPDGQPARVELEKSSGSGHLDNAAIEAVKGWRFIPARRGTEAVEGWVLVPIVFRLQG